MRLRVDDRNISGIVMRKCVQRLESKKRDMETAAANFKCPEFIVQLKFPNSKDGDLLMSIEDDESLAEFKKLLTYDEAMGLGLDCEEFEVIGVPLESEPPSFVNFTIIDLSGKERTLKTFQSWIQEQDAEKYFQRKSFKCK